MHVENLDNCKMPYYFKQIRFVNELKKHRFWWSAECIARKIGVSTRTVYRWIDRCDYAGIRLAEERQGKSVKYMYLGGA